jgi:hypothetical protein
VRRTGDVGGRADAKLAIDYRIMISSRCHGHAPPCRLQASPRRIASRVASARLDTPSF